MSSPCDPLFRRRFSYFGSENVDFISTRYGGFIISYTWLLLFRRKVSPPFEFVPEDGGDIFFRSIGNHLQDYMVSEKFSDDIRSFFVYHIISLL